MKAFVPFLVAACLLSKASLASSFDGVWKLDYGCNKIGADSCAPDDHGYFELDFLSLSNRICGEHEMKLERSDDIDDPTPIYGKISGKAATVDFASSFGARGRARLSLQKGKLVWKVVRVEFPASRATGGIPNSAVLTRQGDLETSQRLHLLSLLHRTDAYHCS